MSITEHIWSSVVGSKIVQRGSNQLKRSLLLIALALTWAALSPAARAVDPPPDGGYPNANTAEGDGALQSLTTGALNTAIGFQTLFNTTTGSSNTAIGWNALFSNTTGIGNTASGINALLSNTRGRFNTAVGLGTLNANTSGNFNTATGFSALSSNSGSFNTANGSLALSGNSTGINNTATGFHALGNGTGNGNTANGASALFGNRSGSRNTANGVNALENNSTGNFNVAEGAFALSGNVSGSSNIAMGVDAGSNVTSGSDNIDIGARGAADESGTIRIGTPAKQGLTYIAGIRGAATANANAVPVVIDSAGQLGTIGSSRRFKEEIKPMDKTSETLLSLKPVTFHYKSDTQNTPQFGLIAEEVAKVNPNLVVRDENGQIYTVRYEAVNAMLLNEFLKEHRNVAEQQSTIAELKTTIAQQQKQIAAQQATAAQQQKQIEALIATVRQVSERVELSAPAPQIVANGD